MSRARRASRDEKPRRPPWARAVVESGSLPERSPTAVAAEALRTGVIPSAARRRPPEIPREDDTIRVGDPDDDSLANEYVGDETPGGTAPTPDQGNVDDIGRAYGLQEEDTGALRSGEEVLARRDRHRSELRPPGKPFS
ncbi:MAG TPA: DUF6335 family protein [Vicinamibacteria bacterium]|nr:DUF6335 family protein [Vicinamibacteria bacterium]